MDKLRIYVDKVENPNRFLRYILNRLHLDDASIRAASISCLGEMALKVDHLKDEVLSILRSFLHDLDTEVRDRAYYYNKILSGDQEFSGLHKNNCFDVADLENIQALIKTRIEKSDSQPIEDLIKIPTNLGTAKATNIISQTEHGLEAARGAGQQVAAGPADGGVAGPITRLSGALFDPEMAQFFEEHDDFEDCGELRLSSEFVDLCDKDSEFYTQLRKHLFDGFVVLEYKIANNDDEHVRSSYPLTGAIDLIFERLQHFFLIFEEN